MKGKSNTQQLFEQSTKWSNEKVLACLCPRARLSVLIQCLQESPEEQSIHPQGWGDRISGRAGLCIIVRGREEGMDRGDKNEPVGACCWFQFCSAPQKAGCASASATAASPRHAPQVTHVFCTCLVLLQEESLLHVALAVPLSPTTAGPCCSLGKLPWKAWHPKAWGFPGSSEQRQPCQEAGAGEMGLAECVKHAVTISFNLAHDSWVNTELHFISFSFLHLKE